MLWALLIALGVAQAWLGYALRELHRAAHALEDEKGRLMQQLQALKLERAALLRPERLRKEAARRGMRPPRAEQVWHEPGAEAR
ncbi:MAG: hypothetical protein D6771_00415 [Zetaproteobacteria bacterium]|nr:MAG: hypothetical protein D6771_00415 [Zetaproteobacteria bacterium]